MARKTFFSFHYVPDNWRAAQVRNMGALEGNAPVSDNDWEAVKKGGDPAIERWIAGQMSRRSCTAVLIGEMTAGRKWITHEIQKSWEKGIGVFGIYIHNLKDKSSSQCQKGGNPFDALTLDGEKLSTIVKAYNPPYTTSTDVYDYISNNIADWAEEAVKIRNKYAK